MQPKLNLQREKNDNLVCYNYQNDYCFLQFHSQIEIYIVDEGEMNMLVDGKQKTLKAGEMSVALSFVPHDYKTSVASKSSAIIIPPRLCEDFIRHIGTKKLSSPFISDPEIYKTVKDCFNKLRDENINHISRRGYLGILLGAVLDGNELIESEKPTDTTLASKILLYIDENYKNDLTAASVAEHFGYSKSYISRYFRACCGITLVRYITLMRLRQAVILMSSGKFDTAYCIMESGFSSMTTFYRSFRAEFGYPPKEYLKKHI